MHILLEIRLNNGEVARHSFTVETDEDLIWMVQHYAGPKVYWTLYYNGRPIGPYFVKNSQYRDWRDYYSRQYRLELKFIVPMDIENPDEGY